MSWILFQYSEKKLTKYKSYLVKTMNLNEDNIKKCGIVQYGVYILLII